MSEPASDASLALET